MAKWNGPGSLKGVSGTMYGPGDEIGRDDMSSMDEKRRNQLIDKGFIEGNKKRTATSTAKVGE